MSNERQFSPVDRLLMQADAAMRTLLPFSGAPARPSPAILQNESALSDDEARHVAGLMRINHTGEVCAQALYQGQALTAKLPQVRKAMEHAADEEIDHLAWCEQRVRELDSHTSLLAPVWYAGAFAIGAVTGLAGDRTSLGFVSETERQVIEHLESHLHEKGLPDDDERSRRIVQQMQDDEARHGADARAAGGRELPRPIRDLMRATARIMTRTAYRV